MNRTKRGQPDLFEKVAGRTVDFVNKYEAIDESDIRASWFDLKKKLPGRTNRFRRRVLLSAISAAAIIAVVFFVLPGPGHDALRSPLDISMLEDTVDYNNREILLIADGNVKELANESEIRYDPDGNLFAGGDTIGSTGKTKSNATDKIIVPAGRRMSITLSDGTFIYVNSGSKVVLHRAFDPDKREILASGELYLEVKKDEGRPFYVKTDAFNVRVTGTSFNIRTYDNEPASVVLIEGGVEVNNQGNTIGVKPSQMLVVDQDNISLSYVDVNEHIAWTDDILYLDNHKLDYIIGRISNFFGIDISFDPETGNIPAGGKLNLRNGLNDVMDILCLSFGLRVETDENGNISLLKK